MKVIMPQLKAAQMVGAKPEKIKGTQIRQIKGGGWIRVVSADGKEFPVAATKAVHKYLRSIGEEVAGGEEGKDNLMGAKPVKIKGTQIKQVKGGGFVRVVNEDGKEFPIQANKTVCNYLRSIGQEVVKGGSKSKAKKERTPEEQEAYKHKMAEKHQQTIEKEGRVVVGNQYTLGEIIARGGQHFWVKAKNPSAIPAAVKGKLQAMNDEARAKDKKFLGGKDDLGIFVRLGDVAMEGLSLKPGTDVKFKLYTDEKGVGGCEVLAA